MTNRIMHSWESFRKAVMPLDAPPDQIREMRRAFFAGAHGMLQIMTLISREEVSESDSLVALEEAHREALDFARRVERGEY